jgi:twitching motility protein PilT
MATLPELLKTLVEREGSDLHVTINTPPQIRVHGHLQRVDGTDLTASETKQLAYSVLTDAQKKRFEETLELDFSFGIKGLARFRVNMFNQRGAVGAVYRLIPEKIRSFQELTGQLHLPPGFSPSRLAVTLRVQDGKTQAAEVEDSFEWSRLVVAAKES